MFRAIVFAVHDCGFVVRSAQEADDSGEVRIEKLYKIIEECRFGIHDVSRTELNELGLPRFNMPLELGIFLGARRFGGTAQKLKKCLILEREKYSYQKFCSDISGQDIRAHQDDPDETIAAIRKWAAPIKKEEVLEIPGEGVLSGRYKTFTEELPKLCKKAQITTAELTFSDYVRFVVTWLEQNPW